MDAVIGIIVVAIIVYSVIGWFLRLGGGGSSSDFDTKDPGDDY